MYRLSAVTGSGPRFDERLVFVEEHDRNARYVGGLTHLIDEFLE